MNKRGGKDRDGCLLGFRIGFIFFTYYMELVLLSPFLFHSIPFHSIPFHYQTDRLRKSKNRICPFLLMFYFLRLLLTASINIMLFSSAIMCKDMGCLFAFQVEPFMHMHSTSIFNNGAFTIIFICKIKSSFTPSSISLTFSNIIYLFFAGRALGVIGPILRCMAEIG